MNFITFLSNLMIPIIIFYIIGYGILSKTNIFDSFVKGAEDGLKVVVGILPTLIGLLIAIGLMRESGFLTMLAEGIKPFAERLHFPAEVVPLALVKMISSSAASGLLLDLFKSFGTDSREGYLASLLMCCSETIFYTISVYFLATKDGAHKAVTGMRWLLAGALICTFAGIVVSVLLTDYLVG
ncbi:MAG: spore maturation protein [Clostridiaceae bacterium]|nr:spore maturation protein [Clostridiaceae bacterium]